MRRRDFIKVIAGSATTWPLAAGAQQPGQPHNYAAQAIAPSCQSRSQRHETKKNDWIRNCCALMARKAKDMNLPWTKREIVDAVIAGYRSVDENDASTWAQMQCLRIFADLALGRSDGRQAPYIEDALYARVVRAWTAINKGRDPNAAYDVPLADERPLTTDDQLSGQYRLVAKLLDAEDARRQQRQRP